MFDRFTENARRMMGLARQAAQWHCHDYIGPEHMLLGLAEMPQCAAAKILADLGVDLSELRKALPLKRGPAQLGGMGQLPFTPSAKQVLESALAEARRLGHGYIGTEHLLVGLVLDEGGITGITLARLGVTLEGVWRSWKASDEAAEATPPMSVEELRTENVELRCRIEELDRRVAELEERFE